MPLFICFCPDYTDLSTLDKRTAARPDHLAAGKRDRESGKTVFGRAFIDDASGESRMAGSTMIYRYDTLEQALERIKADPYWKEGVWDKEKLIVKELFSMDGDDLLRVTNA